MEQRRIAEYTRKTKETDIYLSFDFNHRAAPFILINICWMALQDMDYLI